MRRKILAAALFSSLASVSLAWADDVVYYEKDGVTYRETRRKVSRPVTQLEYQNQPQSILREKLDYGTQDAVRTYQVPVTEYQTQSRLVGRWNPFIRQPYYESRQIPVTRWETKTETVKVPCVKRSLVHETSTAQVPVYQTRVQEDEIISRVAVGTRPNTSVASSAPNSSSPYSSPSQSSVGSNSGSSSASGATSSSASAPGNTGNTSGGLTVGGVSKLDQDPPRMGNNVQWRPGSAGQRY
jgi:hypothetical protein